MSREILFRGKRIDNGKLVEGFIVTCDERYFISKTPECDTGKYMLNGYWFGIFFEVTQETIGQCTGMTDESGKKIFEGDIFKYTTSTVDGNPICGKACIDSIFNYELMKNMDTSNSLEIIGNIYENPESLK